MKRSFFKKIGLVFCLTCFLFLQFGCEEQHKTSPETAPTVAESKPALTRPKVDATSSRPDQNRAKPPSTVKPVSTKPAAPPSRTTPKPRPSVVKNVAESNQSRPRITFDETVYNFGNIAPRSNNIHRYKFKNTGDAKLQITGVRTCCGVIAKLVGDKRYYAPGESGEVEVRYNAAPSPTTVSKTVYVQSNDKDRPKLGLSFKARVVMKVDHEPKRLNLLLNKENAGCPDITLKSLDTQPFAIQRCRSTADCITIDYDTSVKKTQFVLKPKVDVKKLQNNLGGRIDIQLTHPECRSVAVHYSALPKFRLNPPSLVIFKAKPEESVKRTIYVLSNYKEDFKIEAATSQKNIIKVLNQKKIPSGYQFDLEITPPSVSGKTRLFTDVFSVKLKDAGKLTVTCRGFYDVSVIRPSGS